MTILNERQKKLITALRKNGRQKIHELAKRNNIATSSLTDMLHRLEDKGLIEHKTHVAFDRIGYFAHIIALVKTGLQDRERVQKFLVDCPNVNTLAIINSGLDFHFQGIFGDMKEAQDFIDEMTSRFDIVQKQVHQVLKTVHEERFLSEESHFKDDEMRSGGQSPTGTHPSTIDERPE